jgi:hypothetical protein
MNLRGSIKARQRLECGELAPAFRHVTSLFLWRSLAAGAQLFVQKISSSNSIIVCPPNTLKALNRIIAGARTAMSARMGTQAQFTRTRLSALPFMKREHFKNFDVSCGHEPEWTCKSAAALVRRACSRSFARAKAPASCCSLYASADGFEGCLNPKGIASQSPGLRGTSYPGFLWATCPTLKGLRPPACRA